MSLFGINLPTDGLAKGLQYDVDFARMLSDAITRTDPQELADLKAIADQFRHEAADEAGVLKHNIVQVAIAAGIGIGHDPFAVSRKMMQDAEAKYGYVRHK